MGGKEVANGAIIVRTGGKLYIVDGKPAEVIESHSRTGLPAAGRAVARPGS